MSPPRSGVGFSPVLGFAMRTIMSCSGAVGSLAAALTFAGFQTFDDQTSRIFLHITREPALDVEKEGKRVVFILRNTRILVGNNKNPLNLEHFATPAKRARGSRLAPPMAVEDQQQFARPGIRRFALARHPEAVAAIAKQRESPLG